MKSIDRREFLRVSSAMSGMGVAAPLALNLAAMGSASAQTATGYKALVCIFLYGGNDGYNTVLATDTGSWTNYTTMRNPKVRNPSSTGESIALLAQGVAADSSKPWGSNERLGGVLSIANANRLGLNAGRQFALHPVLANTKSLYAGGRVAVVPNIGPLIRPTSKDQFALASHPKPAKLFSHNDQQSTWQSFSPEGSTAGWGGRIADMLTANGSATFASVGVGSSAVWLSGNSARQFQINTNGVYRMGVDDNGNVFGSSAVYGAMRSIVKQAAPDRMLESDYASVNTRSLDAESTLKSAVPEMMQAPWGTPAVKSQSVDPKLQYISPNSGTSTTNPLAVQLQGVARMIAARKNTGINAARQVFFVNLSGFDTHSTQLSSQAELLARLDHALGYFDTVLAAMPEGDMRNSVTTFTASDFGRTFTNNNGGSDHGWGSHHFVMGGAVNGGDVYGHFPVYGVNNSSGVFDSPNQIVNGVMLPEYSVEQLSYTLGSWMGVSDTDLTGTAAAPKSGILPNLRSYFNASDWSLKFMKA
jgi:uncharacterized protein (DUF1501 family)